MLKKLKDFRRKTHEQYNTYHREHMDSWKEHVLKLHEESGFLFYYETSELASPEGDRLIIYGDIAKDERIKGERIKPLPLYMYDGQGRLIGQGLLMSDPFEKEEKRRGFLRARKHEFVLEFDSLYGKKYQDMDEALQRKQLLCFYREVSLLSDICLL